MNEQHCTNLTNWSKYTVSYNYGNPWFLLYSFWINRHKAIKFSRPSQCCYVRQNTLLAQLVFKVSAFGFNPCTKMCAPLSNCCINNALIHFVLSCQDTCTQFVNVLDPLLVDILLHYGPHVIVRTVWWPSIVGMNSGVSIVSSSIVSRALRAGAMSCWNT